MKLNKKRGFTLLEIIIVIIIIGVLASLALPKFFSTIQFAKSTEAMNALGEIRRAADRCAMMGGTSVDYAACNTFDKLGMEIPNSSTWGYVINSANTSTFIVTSLFNVTGYINNSITLTANSTGASKAGTGIFSGIR